MTTSPGDSSISNANDSDWVAPVVTTSASGVVGRPFALSDAATATRVTSSPAMA